MGRHVSMELKFEQYSRLRLGFETEYQIGHLFDVTT